METKHLIKRLIPVLVCISVSILSVTLYAYDEAAKQRFLKEYPVASKAFSDRLSVSSGKGTIKTSTKSMKKSETLVFNRDHGYEKVEAIVEGEVGKAHVKSQVVYCLGPETFFQIIKSNENNDFALRSIGSSENDRQKYIQKYGRYLWVPLGSHLGLLPDLMKDPSFELVDVSPPDAKTGYVTIQFRFSEAEPKDTGQTVLDPANHWAVISDEREVGINRRMKIRMDVAYGPKTGEFAMPKEADFTGPGMPSEPFEFEEWKFEPTPLAEFQLPYYQMPDVPLTNAHDNRFKYIMGVIAILILLLVLAGWYFNRLARKSNLQAPSV